MDKQFHSKFNFGKTLRTLLTEKNMSELTLATKANIPVDVINSILSGENTKPEVDTLKKIAEVLEIDLIDFLYLSIKPDRSKPKKETEIPEAWKEIDRLMDLMKKEIDRIASLPEMQKKKED